MEEQLKEYSIVHKLALNFDYVPSLDELEDTWEYVLEYMDLNISKRYLKELMEKYCGYDTGDVTSEAFHLIDELYP